MQPLLTSMTYSECLCVALGIRHAMCMRHIVICGLSGCTVFFTLSRKRQDFQKKKPVIENKIVF
jgi:hypothetical protein